MHSIKDRVAALAAVLMPPQRSIPYEKMDPLSQGLYDIARELSALDKQGKAELLAEMNRGGAQMDMEALERMIRSITVEYY